ncbi:MAG: glycoside hydrolase family 97 N-terminal domain-containing protein, partial [Bacteroidales bacterium]|nr:glycoside hydrolase family 97 N-terminal domain-containing protein [Bacteroidales bacterium]
MKKILLLLLVFTTGMLYAIAAEPVKLNSPDGQLELRFELKDGVPYYALNRNGKPVVLPSKMGFLLEWRDDMAHAFVLKDTQYDTFDETWEPVWGEEARIRNHYNEMLVTLEQPVGSVESMDHSTESKATVMQIRFRLYDDGLGFRYEFPIENALVCFWFKEELTEFAMAGDHKAWWIPGDLDTQEYNYTESRLSQIPELWEAGHKDGGWPWTAFSKTGVQTALQMKTDDGLYLNIHEAATLDFPTMHLDLITQKEAKDGEAPFVFRAFLCPDATGYKGRIQTPCTTPWRTLMVCEKATDVLASRLILNLNDPCALEDVSWIHPVKYMGVWWEMISGKSTWAYTNDFPSVKLGLTDYEHATPNGTHGANNANVRRYIDFAAQHG